MGESGLVYVPVKFERDAVAAIDRVARADRSLWFDRGGAVGEAPSRSAAVRQLVDEALAARAKVGASSDAR